jgi:hypothetical protein
MAKPQVTAFVLDDSVAVGADGGTIPGVPGIWFHDRPTLASALEYTVQEMRDAIEQLGLPLKEVKVPEGDAHDTFPVASNRMPSAREGLRGGDEGEAPEVAMVSEADPQVLDDTLDRADRAAEEADA